MYWLDVLPWIYLFILRHFVPKLYIQNINRKVIWYFFGILAVHLSTWRINNYKSQKKKLNKASAFNCFYHSKQLTYFDIIVYSVLLSTLTFKIWVNEDNIYFAYEVIFFFILWLLLSRVRAYLCNGKKQEMECWT